MQSATEGYLTLASHISGIAPYELPQVVAQIPPPPMDIPMPVRKALMIDGENKVVNYILCREYELNKTSWSKITEKNIMLVRIRCMWLSREKEDQEAPNITRRRNKELKWKLPHLILIP